MNVCVQGPCMVRNHSHSKEQQFFDDAVSPGDTMFLCIVSVFKPRGGVGFRLKPATSRQLAHLMSTDGAGCAPGGPAADFGIDELLSTVAAWKLSRVIDGKKVFLPSKGVEACVAIDMLLIDDFWEAISPGSGISAMEARMQLCNNRIMKNALKDLRKQTEDAERLKAYEKMLEWLAREEAQRKRKLE
eukprot:5801200-Prymnesium_polylepis.1